MCNRSKVNNKFGKSKGFGFVEFAEHGHALRAMRHLNNNPEIFSNDKRPIVEFSIENKVMINRKKYRAIKQEKMKTESNKSNQINLTEVSDQKETTYSGVMTKPLSGDDKVIQPTKLNRKIGQGKIELKKRNKKIKADKKKRENLKRHHQNKEIKNLQNAKRKQLDESDVYDAHFKKRKHVFVSMNNSSKNESQVKRKTKWFME